MSDRSLLATWIDEANKRMSKQEDKHDDLRIDFTRLKAQVDTRNKIIWALMGFLIAAGATIIALVSLLNKLR